ncbi:MAG: TSUP family transporter [Eubacteriales bacterium]|nr:TSUP family transporter [Eubacteriales bacterium]
MAVMVGAVLGFLSGLGIGGGSLLILYLTLAAGMPQAAARGINLLFFLPCAATAAFLRWRQGAVDLKKLWPAMAAGCASAAALTILGPEADSEALRKGFGVLLLVTGLREVLYRKR